MAGKSTSKPLNTAEMLVKCLEKEGVQYIFGIPGEENLAIIDALQRSTIRFITVRHEQGAAFMADMVGRLTGRAGVCLSTLGPGATNLVTGVADANGDGAPLVAITGQVGTDRMHLTSHQFLDLCKMFEPITKRSKQIVRPDTVSEIVRIAFKYAESEKPGACHIDLPVNIARMPVGEGEEPLAKKTPPIEEAEESTIREAAEAIGRAQSPVILAGSSAVRSRAGEALTEFAETLHIPVVNTMMAKGLIPFDSPYSLWTIGIPEKDYANKVLEKSDLIVAVGYDIVEYAPSKWNSDRHRRMIHIDSRPAHINKLYQPQVEVVGDISMSLRQILGRVSRTGEPRAGEPRYALAIKRRMVREYETYERDDSFPMKPQRILSDVRKVLGREDILISDVGAHKMWIARQYHCYRPNTCIISNGFATMGIAVPGAVAAKLIHPEKKILAVTGDGGFLMNCQELETAVRIGTPFVTLIFHDDHYGLIQWKQISQYGESHCVDFGNPDFVKFAESFGAVGYRVERAQDLEPTLREAFAQQVPAIIDCPVNYGENVKLTAHLREIYETL